MKLRVFWKHGNVDPLRDYMTHRQELEGFPDTCLVSLHKNNKINKPIIAVPAGKWQLRSTLSVNALYKHFKEVSAPKNYLPTL
jgi:hypothetical protein